MSPSQRTLRQLPTTWRILTVRQPWADLIVPDEGVIARVASVRPDVAEQLPKTPENRSKGTPHRGGILIHAGLKFDDEAMEQFGFNPDWFVLGAVVGVVTLENVIDDSDSYWAREGQKHWQFADQVRLLSPVICVGGQGPLHPTQAVLVSVLASLAHQGALSARVATKT